MILTALKLIPDWAKVIGGCFIGALIATGPIYLYAKSATRTELQAEASKEAINRITDMEKRNAGFKNLPARDRCLALMRDSGLPDSECPDEW